MHRHRGPHRSRSRGDRMLRAARLSIRPRTRLGALAILAAALGLLPAAQASAAPRPLATAGQSLASALTRDGSLKATKGSFRADGYAMRVDGKGRPHFYRKPANLGAPTGAPAIGAAAALAGTDASWSDRFGITGIPSALYIKAVAVSGNEVYVGG